MAAHVVIVLAGLGFAAGAVLAWSGRWRSWAGHVLGSMPVPLVVFPAAALVVAGYEADRAGVAVLGPLALVVAAALVALGAWGPAWLGPRWYRERRRHGPGPELADPLASLLGAAPPIPHAHPDRARATAPERDR
jgi:hypothetical protein